MLKLPRFVKEYASYQKRWIKNHPMLNPGIKREYTRRIEHWIKMLEIGLITVDECMRCLTFPETGEDLTQYME